MLKTIIFQIEGIMDTQKILKIESSPQRPKPSLSVKREKEVEKIRPEDIAKKYTNIKVRKVSICSTPEKIQKLEERQNEKLIVIEALQDDEKPKVLESSPKVHRALMCISCSEKFTDLNQLQSHLKSCKTPSNHLKCFCGKILQSQKALAVHVYTEHKNYKKKHICTVCKKVFTSLFNLQNHMESHKGSSQLKGTFWCQVCDEKFSEMELLKKHRESSKCGSKKMSEA
jgi:stress-induced morphogen